MMKQVRSMKEKADIEGSDDDKRTKAMQAEREMFETLKAGDFHFPLSHKDKPIPARWSQAVKNQAFKKEYQQAASKEDFRKEWAKKTYAAYSNKSVQTNTLSKVDINSSRYLTLARIAHKEGGGRTGMRNALKQANQAVAIGPPWVKLNDRSKAMKFLYLEEGYDEKFEVA